MLRKTIYLAFGMIVALAALALPAGGQNKKEPVSLLHLTANAQNLGSPCQGKPELVCVKVNWTVSGVPAVNNIADFVVLADATNGNPASKNRDDATVLATARTATLKLFPTGASFKVKVVARNSSHQPLATVEATGSF